ncbi:MAG: J domain-containing protein [Lachnospiraceae bacterium]|nr:J domain-containing protein [Lachnospiraceae bacterium]
MTRREAYKILGISPETSKDEIKKRYRQLMFQVHPDSVGSSAESCRYSAQEINIAYELVSIDHHAEESDEGDFHKAAGARHRRGKSAQDNRNDEWGAPINGNAYREREILCYAEDYDGTALGSFCIAKGKYLWTTEEEFPLFLLSIYQCGKQLLDECDEQFHDGAASADRQLVQAELTYLLTQQFINGSALLQELAKEEMAEADGKQIFYVSAMVELTAGTVSLETGEFLYPSKLRQHRLYLQNQKGREIGYLSFHDDRFYYIVEPLFEQKRVQIKIQVAEKQEKRRHSKTPGYRNLHLWIKLLDVSENYVPENLNLRIEELMEAYKKS